MLIFDSGQRTDQSPARHNESRFDFYNRSAWPACEHIRDTIEQWFTRYPEEHSAEMRSRLRSEFRAAFYELLLHELLLRLGCAIQVHPDLHGDETGRRPDFLVSDPNGSSYYVEARLAVDQSTSTEAEESVRQQVIDALDKLDSPNFFIGIDEMDLGTTAPSGRKIRLLLQHRLADLDPDVVGETILRNGYEASPRWVYDDGENRLVFYPIPRPPQKRGPGNRTFGVGPIEGGAINSSKVVKRAVSRKSNAYKNLNLPLVLAINGLSKWGIDDDDVLSALYGSEVIVFSRNSRQHHLARERDGAWMSPAGPINTRISAILFVDSLQPPSVGSTPMHMYYNPWAAIPYSGALDSLPSVRMSEARLERKAGKNSWEVLGLPPNWPRHVEGLE